MSYQKTALITGASSGIGFEATKQLADKGYKIYAAARRLTLLESLEAKYPGQVIAVELDVSDPEQIVALRERFAAELPDQKLDLLYNNAGQSCTFAATDATHEIVERAFKVNVFGPMNLCRELSQFLINSGGTIVFTGSVAGLVPFPFGSVYGATKAAIHQYARVLHQEMKCFNVRVINVVTGGVHTDIADKRGVPENSLFNVPEARAALEARREMAKNNHPMSVEKYVARVVHDIESRRDPVDVYRGRVASLAYWISWLVPYAVLERIVFYRFKLFPFYNAMRRKHPKSD
ncbi:LAMI_0C08306g1_1 [Lachancea mirantina]|uniref:LAMI_0C08306g1_1 n=1 Tax=Lachancea mirantina TaxID=1230905 RepID=A0A1G4J4E8_9SACH|nr:LAMI_0C08306g1_1 [Lachancea mirantina]